MKKLIETLDRLLLSGSVVEDFYAEYRSNEEFKKNLNAILPEVELCEKQQQNNPWHKYNVLGHILHSVEEMNKMTKTLDHKTRRMLAYVMFLHDIGKPAKHLVRRKDGEIIDSFFDHNIESANIAKSVLPQFGFTPEEVEIMEKLVFKHDIFMFITDVKNGNPYHRFLTTKLIEDEVKDLSSVGDGYELMRYLIMIGRADNLAQNEKMTQSSLKKLSKMDGMLTNLSQSEF